MAPVPRPPDPVAELDILSIEEETLVEPAEFVHDLAADQEESTPEPVHIPLLRLAVPPVIVRARPAEQRLAAARQRRRADRDPEWRREPPCRLLQRPVFVKQPARHRPDRRLLLHHPEAVA